MTETPDDISTRKVEKEFTDAMARLVRIAKRDTGQSKRVADFLLAWWRATKFGGFDLTDLWVVDDSIRVDMLTVIQFIATRQGKYPDSFGFDLGELVDQWR